MTILDSVELDVAALPVGAQPDALPLPHFPTAQQALVWRNWELVPVARLARVLETSEANVLQMARELGLRVPPRVGAAWLDHGYNTLIRANWHLLPYEQLLQLLDWTPAHLDAVLREDDFLWVKLGFLKPKCQPLFYQPLTDEQRAQTARLAASIERHFPDHNRAEGERPFAFIADLQTPATPPRLNWNGAILGANEVCLDENWSLAFPRLGAGSHLEALVREFRRAHAARFGLGLKDAEKGEGGPRLSLELRDDFEGPRESHAVRVEANAIRIEAGDEVGLLRGLQMLETQMEKRGAPALELGLTARRPRFDLRLIYPYCGVYGDALRDAESDPFPDGLLERLSRMGVNGVWLQGLLTQLFPWSLAPELSAGYEQRLANLRALAARAADYGIGVYLYLNEPRGLPTHFFETHPELEYLRGLDHPSLNVASLCTSQSATLDYLRDGSFHLFSEVPELAGVFTITMSENPTHCHSVPSDEPPCPRCQGRATAALVAEVNGAIEAGVHAARPVARVLAWNWGDKWPSDAIALLPTGVELMAVSEEGVPTDVGGIEGAVLDYSMSQIGPGPKARAHWEMARTRGLKTVAKVQINNTWECSALPYLPVPDLVDEHLERLDDAGVSGLMLSWTLGGYPAPNLEIAARHFWEETRLSLDDLAARRFGASDADVRAAWREFSEAFRQFPFHIGVLYTAPQNYGPMNLLHSMPTGYKATMVGLPYDDLESWRAIYPADIFENQWRLLCEGWKRGLDCLEKAPQNSLDFAELRRIAQAAYLHFYSTLNQVAFVRRRDELAAASDAATRTALRAELARILDEEIAAAKTLHELMRADARIGYEATNHYYYTAQDLREKVLNCEYFKRGLA